MIQGEGKRKGEIALTILNKNVFESGDMIFMQDMTKKMYIFLTCPLQSTPSLVITALLFIFWIRSGALLWRGRQPRVPGQRRGGAGRRYRVPA